MSDKTAPDRPGESDGERVLRLKLNNAHDALIAIEKYAAAPSLGDEEPSQLTRAAFAAIKEMATDGLFTEIPPSPDPQPALRERLEALADEWERRAEELERDADHGTDVNFEWMATADALRTCGEALREALPHPTDRGPE